MRTSVAIDALDFEDFVVEEDLHIGISVKDFKAIIIHADTLRTSIRALYSYPTKPLLLSYSGHGMECNFTLATIGEYRGSSVTPAPRTVHATSGRPLSRAPSQRPMSQTVQNGHSVLMPPPARPASRSFTRATPSQSSQRPSPPIPKASLNPDSLFLPAEAENDEHTWGEMDYRDDTDTLGWDSNANTVMLNRSLDLVMRLIMIQGTVPTPIGREHGQLSADSRMQSSKNQSMPEPRVAPTQKLSEVNRLANEKMTELRLIDSDSFRR